MPSAERRKCPRWIVIALVALATIACNAAWVGSWHLEEMRYREEHGVGRANSKVALVIANYGGLVVLETFEALLAVRIPRTHGGWVAVFLLSGAIQWGGLGALAGWLLTRPSRRSAGAAPDS
ncbi:MAG: hypothetical protein JNM84_24720 [Planctomycetes bacterium]|nr:hypothetical protein [Planctomycetota bacterium]